jgi:hypothetical protein
MIKSEELKRPESCLNMARSDEPIFVLRANDELAPTVVRRWATEYRNSKTRYGSKLLTIEQDAKHRQALALADQMEIWKSAQIKAERP